MQKNEKYKLLVDLVDSPLKSKDIMIEFAEGKFINKNLNNNEELVNLLASFKGNLPCEVFILLSEMLSFITSKDQKNP
jgi:hypothetical protein